MTTADIAYRLISLCRERKFVEAVELLYGEEVVSVEAMEFGGMPREMRGKENVKRKNVWWLEHNDVNSITVTGPYVGPERFALLFQFDLTTKATGDRSQFTEIAIYDVADGKIVREEFLYAA